MSLSRGDHVITPLGDEAIVQHYRPDGRVELEYVDAMDPRHAQVALPASLLSKIDRHKPRPSPVRVRPIQEEDA